MQNRQRGFTIVELIIVIVVIVILALITFVGYRGLEDRADDAAIQTDLDAISDRIDLKTLDEGALPVGGRTSAGVGTATDFPGITFKATRDSYDTDVANLYYCTGDISGRPEYAVVVQGKSGNRHIYRSSVGTREYQSFNFPTAESATDICTAAGFSAPYTYSVGYVVGTGWSSWVVTD